MRSIHPTFESQTGSNPSTDEGLPYLFPLGAHIPKTPGKITILSSLGLNASAGSKAITFHFPVPQQWTNGPLH